MKLTLQNIRLYQGTFRLDIDHLEVNGEVIGIFGSSGAGKTSLLEIIAGLRHPTSGLIASDETTLTDTAQKIFLPPEHRHIGYVPQDLALFPHLTVRKNLLYGHTPLNNSSGINLPHVAEILEIVPLLDRSTAELSGGQQQRVAFARALLSSPRLLLMDEPLASLDHDLRARIIPYLQRIRDEFKIPLLYVSHSPDEIAALCDQVIVLRHGQCLRTSPPSEIFEAASSMRLKSGIYD